MDRIDWRTAGVESGASLIADVCPITGSPDAAPDTSTVSSRYNGCLLFIFIEC